MRRGASTALTNATARTAQRRVSYWGTRLRTEHRSTSESMGSCLTSLSLFCQPIQCISILQRCVLRAGLPRSLLTASQTSKTLPLRSRPDRTGGVHTSATTTSATTRCVLHLAEAAFRP